MNLQVCLVFFFLTKMALISCDQVSRVSDVVSVGQKISLRCIGQDLRGNIKLSLKATLPGQKAEGQNGNSVSSLESVPPVGEVYKSQHETQNSTSSTSLVDTGVGSKVNPTSLVSSILIRSAKDCDEEEKKFAGKNLKFEDTRKPKSASRPKGQSKPSTQNGVKNNKVEVESSTTTRNLKIGMKVRAKIYQVRARGLVLDLGEGVRGMYRFEVYYHFLLFETLYCG